MHNALDEGKRLVCDVKKHEQKNNGHFFAGTGPKMKSGVKTEKNNVGTTGSTK